MYVGFSLFVHWNPGFWLCGCWISVVWTLDFYCVDVGSLDVRYTSHSVTSNQH